MTADDYRSTETSAETSAHVDDVVWDLASSLASTVTQHDVAEAIAKEGKRAAGASFANVTVVEPATGGARVLLPVAGFASTMTETVFDLSTSLPACDAIRTGLPVLLGSTEEIARRYPDLEGEARSAGIGAGASLPLRSRSGSAIGATGFGWHSSQPFTAEQLRRLDLVAQLTGLALERAGSDGLDSDHVAQDALETMPNAFFSLDAAMRFTYANAKAERALERDRSCLLGKASATIFRDPFGSTFEMRCREAVETGRTVVFEEFCTPLKGWFEVHVWPVRQGVHAYFLDISDRRQIELQRTTALGEAQQSNARLRLLNAITARLSGVRARTEVFERLAEAVIPSFADWCTLVVPRGEELVRVAAVHRDPALDGLAKRLVGSYPHAFSGPSPGVVVYRSGEPMRPARLARQIIADLDNSAASNAYGRTLMLLGDGPGLIMPIVSRDEVVAVLTMIRRELPTQSVEPFSDADVAFMHEVETRVADALEDARNVETQRETASALQSAALPEELPVSDRLLLAAGYRAASEGIEVGGDWYDAFELPDDQMVLVVGDAAGHGLGAAASMAQMRNELRAYLFASLGPLEALSSLNRLLVAQSPNTFATIICVQIDLGTGKVRWASAGHPSPVLVHADGTSTYVQGSSMPPIGLVEGLALVPGVEHEFVLDRDDRLILFTDGLVERRALDWEIGLTHLMILAEQTRHNSDPAAACERILKEMLSSAHEDDVCLLVADYTQPR